MTPAVNVLLSEMGFVCVCVKGEHQKTSALISRGHLWANQWEDGMSARSHSLFLLLFYRKKVEESLFILGDVADLPSTPSFIPKCATAGFSRREPGFIAAIISSRSLILFVHEQESAAHAPELLCLL